MVGLLNLLGIILLTDLHARIAITTGNALAYAYSCIILMCLTSKAIYKNVQYYWKLEVGWVISLLAAVATGFLLLESDTKWFLAVSLFVPYLSSI